MIRCYECDMSFSENDLFGIGDVLYCDTCVSSLFSQCARCGILTDSENLNDYDGEDICVSCHSAIEDRLSHASSSEIRETIKLRISENRITDCITSFNLPPAYKTSSKVFYGLEIEYLLKGDLTRESEKSYTSMIKTFHDKKVCLEKVDSTADIEFTFPPSDYDDMLKLVDTFSENIKKSDIFTVGNAVGIHIHAGRRHFPMAHLHKVIYFVNHPSHHKFITHIAGRVPTNYCKRGIKKRLSRDSSNQYYGNDRYSAVNVSTGGKNTVEFRLFASSLDPVIIKSNIEFVKSMVLYPKEVSFDNINLNTYFDYIKENKYLFPNLDKHLQAGGGRDLIKKSMRYPEYKDYAGNGIQRDQWKIGFFKKKDLVMV